MVQAGSTFDIISALVQLSGSCVLEMQSIFPHAKAIGQPSLILLGCMESACTRLLLCSFSITWSACPRNLPQSRIPPTARHVTFL